MSAFTTARRIEFRDTDAAGIVHFSAFFLWMESAEHELLRRVGIPIFDHQSNGTIASWPRVSVSCDYKSPIHFGGEIAITILVEEIGRTSITYGFRFEQAGIWVGARSCCCRTVFAAPRGKSSSGAYSRRHRYPHPTVLCRFLILSKRLDRLEKITCSPLIT